MSFHYYTLDCYAENVLTLSPKNGGLHLFAIWAVHGCPLPMSGMRHFSVDSLRSKIYGKNLQTIMKQATPVEAVQGVQWITYHILISFGLAG